MEVFVLFACILVHEKNKRELIFELLREIQRQIIYGKEDADLFHVKEMEELKNELLKILDH